LVISIKAWATGIGGVFAVGGVLLLGVGYQTMNDQEIGGGWTLIILALIIWLLGFAAKESRRRRWR
jgi:formate hydrogenlyase subunit 3/multisubunit Na+/H+ antiporter MnhD subunit